MAENIASALYEISYLKAREQLESVARKCHEKNKIQNIQNVQNSQNAKYSQKMNSVKVDNNIRKSSVNGNGCISVFERNELAVAAKSVSRCLRVCWSVCGDVLNMMKRRKRRLNSSEESITVSDNDNAARDANYSNVKNHYKNDDGDSNSSNDNSNVNNNNNSNYFNDNHNNNNNTKNTYISKMKNFPPANRHIVDRLLIGLDERVFQPAVSFSFIPPCPRGQK